MDSIKKLMQDLLQSRFDRCSTNCIWIFTLQYVVILRWKNLEAKQQEHKGNQGAGQLFFQSKSGSVFSQAGILQDFNTIPARPSFINKGITTSSRHRCWRIWDWLELSAVLIFSLYWCYIYASFSCYSSLLVNLQEFIILVIFFF